MSQRLRFGIFLAPFHKPGINPTLALQSDLELIQWLDRCGYDEAWLGEHHSAGTELSASPEIMIATAAERTRHIRLGTGVVSVSYHNPLWVAERIVLLDHLTRGRAMLGLGPGSLPTDGVMIGLGQSQTRGLLEDGVAVITKLLTSVEPLTFKNERWDLREARLHLRPYSNPLFDIAVAAVASPTGAKLAGRHGVGMLSVGATTAAGFDALALHWDVLTAEAKAHGKAADRSKWRLVGLCHIAETKEQAYRDVEYGRRCSRASRKSHRSFLNVTGSSLVSSLVMMPVPSSSSPRVWLCCSPIMMPSVGSEPGPRPSIARPRVR